MSTTTGVLEVLAGILLLFLGGCALLEAATLVAFLFVVILAPGLIFLGLSDILDA